MSIEKYKEVFLEKIKEGCGYQQLFDYVEEKEPGKYIYHTVYFYVRDILKQRLPMRNNHKSSQDKRRAIHDSWLKFNNKEQLIQLYSVENKSMQKIAKEYGTTAATVLYALRRFEIPIRKKNGKAELNVPTISKEVLSDLYYNKQMSLADIAIAHELPNGTRIQQMMDYYELPRRSYSEAGKVMFVTKADYRQKILKGLRNYQFDNPSSLEKVFINWCKENNIQFEFQYQIIENTHNYDFWIKDTNILVEMDGDYWHNTEASRKRDAFWNKFAERFNYTVVRFYEFVVENEGYSAFERVLKDQYGIK